jgi:hypothetical protein
MSRLTIDLDDHQHQNLKADQVLEFTELSG